MPTWDAVVALASNLVSRGDKIGLHRQRKSPLLGIIFEYDSSPAIHRDENGKTGSVFQLGLALMWLDFKYNESVQQSTLLGNQQLSHCNLISAAFSSLE